MRLAHTLLFLLFTALLTAQSTPNEQTMARLAGELTAKLNGKKLKKVAILRLTFNDDPGSPEGAWLADEMAFALQASGPDFAIIPRADIEQKTADYAARQAAKKQSSATSNSADDYSEDEYTEETYNEESYEEESYEETSYEEETYEEYEEGKSATTEKSYTEEESSTGTNSKAAKKKKNTGLVIGGALLAAGAVALFAGNKKPMAGVRATITGTIVEQGDRLVVTFRAVDKKGRVLGMARGRFVREE